MSVPQCLSNHLLQVFFSDFLPKLAQANVQIIVANEAVTIPEDFSHWFSKANNPR